MTTKEEKKYHIVNSCNNCAFFQPTILNSKPWCRVDGTEAMDIVSPEALLSEDLIHKAFERCVVSPQGHCELWKMQS